MLDIRAPSQIWAVILPRQNIIDILPRENMAHFKSLFSFILPYKSRIWLLSHFLAQIPDAISGKRFRAALNISPFDRNRTDQWVAPYLSRKKKKKSVSDGFRTRDLQPGILESDHLTNRDFVGISALKFGWYWSRPIPGAGNTRFWLVN